jgi:GNAT superfamily N-acetyltransferase
MMTDSAGQVRTVGFSNLAQMELIRAVTERGAAIRTRVSGFSMSPFIRDGDVLTIAPLDGRAPHVGEVVAFAQSDTGRLAIHRVVAAMDGAWLMRGDNSPEADGVAPRENLLGVVTRVERGGREVRLGLGAERGLIAALNRGNGLLRLKTLWYLPRRAAGFALRCAQALSLYRALGRRFAPRIAIAEARADDMETVQRHLNPSQLYRAQPPNPNVTNWVAKRGEKVIGFVQLMRHPQEHFPWVGHWLFALEVWGRYRGLGIGERLTRRVIAQAVAEGAPELLLAVFENNNRAIGLYQKLGFEPITVTALESQFAADKQQFGRRRIVMRKSWSFDLEVTDLAARGTLGMG